MANSTLGALNQTQLELLQRYDGQFRKLEDKANALKKDWQKIADSAKKQIDTTNKLVNEKVQWAEDEINNFKNNVADLFPTINIYPQPMTFGRDTDSTSVPHGCYGWTKQISRSYSYRQITNNDKAIGFPDRMYIGNNPLVCKEHWKANADNAKIATPNAIGHNADINLARKITGYITFSFYYRITNATGNFEEKLSAAGYNCNGNWNKKVVVFNATNKMYKAFWPIFMDGINNGSEVDFEWAMLKIIPGSIPNIGEHYIEYIAK